MEKKDSGGKSINGENLDAWPPGSPVGGSVLGSAFPLGSALAAPSPAVLTRRPSSPAVEFGPVLCPQETFFPPVPPLFQHIGLCGHFISNPLALRAARPKASASAVECAGLSEPLLTKLPSLSSSAQPGGPTPALLV